MGNNRQLTWRHLKALNDLYVAGRSSARVTDNSYIQHLINNKKVIKPRVGNLKILDAQKEFKKFYEDNFYEDFIRYQMFFSDNSIEDDARKKYLEDDIATLIFIAEQKENLIHNLSTVRTFSTLVFKDKGSKYLENNQSLKSAVCKILEITDFPDEDPKNLQWRFVVDCVNPNIVVLCENIAHLKNGHKARKHNIELWYVGGSNIAMIDHISPEKLRKPLYYSCDWDYHGLRIFSNIKKKIAEKSAFIKILVPPNLDNSLPVDSPFHGSIWDLQKELSGLNHLDFSEKEKTVIQKLIKENKWIEEESMDLIELLISNSVI